MHNQKLYSSMKECKMYFRPSYVCADFAYTPGFASTSINFNHYSEYLKNWYIIHKNRGLLVDQNDVLDGFNLREDPFVLLTQYRIINQTVNKV